jgi:hypothetical protein
METPTTNGQSEFQAQVQQRVIPRVHDHKGAIARLAFQQLFETVAEQTPAGEQIVEDLKQFEGRRIRVAAPVAAKTRKPRKGYLYRELRSKR